MIRCLRIAILLCACAFISSCGAPNETGAGGRVLRRGLSGEPATLDPGVVADSFSGAVLLDLYEGLTAENAAGDVVPGVAESWSINASGTEYVFKIRASAEWSNGKRVRAQDFVATWRRDINPDFASPSAENLRFIAHANSILARKEPPSALGVSAPQDDVLVVNLERPTAFFLQVLAHPSTFPVYNTVSPNNHDPATWISNGPYVLESWRPTSDINLTANSNYWGRKDLSVKLVRYQISPGDAAQYAAYRSGELDLTDTVPANALPMIRQQRPTELIVAPFLGTVYYAFNFSNKLFLDADVRQALSMAIDRKRLVDSLGFGQGSAYGLVPPGTANYSPQSYDWSSLTDDQRISEAKRLYSKAGFASKSPLHLRILMNENEVIRRTAILIGAMWKEVLGVEMEIDSEEYKVFLQTRVDRTRWDIARLAWTADFNDASNFLEILRTRSVNNNMTYSNATTDAMLNQAAEELNSSQRRSTLQHAEKQALNDYPIIPLYFLVSKRLVKPYLRGAIPSPMNHLPSKAISFQSQ